MKRHLSLAIAILMFVAVWATTAQSQAANPRLMRAHIPFAFNVGTKQLPAGVYNITVLNPSSDQKVLQIRSTDGSMSAIVSTIAAKSKSPDQSKVVFHRYGDTYFFAQAQVSGELTTLAAVKSSTERTEERVAAHDRRNANVAILVQ